MNGKFVDTNAHGVSTRALTNKLYKKKEHLNHGDVVGEINPN